VADPKPEEPPPFALAAQWFGRISTITLEMSLPAIGGNYLDGRFGTSYLALIGLILGVTVGVWHLMLVAREFK